MMRSFLIALQFLTRLPVSISSEPDENTTAHSLVYYPLVGLLIGVLLVALSWVFDDIPALLSAGLLLTVWVLVTGGLHLDGLADSLDAWVGGLGDRDKTMAIMKDPYCGPAGVVGIVLLLLIKFAALQVLIEAGNMLALLITPILGRAVIQLLFITTPYVRQNGLGATIANHLPRQLLMLIIFFIIIALFILMGIETLWLLLMLILVFSGLRRTMMRRIGGMTGDLAGALVEIIEATVLVTLIVISQASIS